MTFSRRNPASTGGASGSGPASVSGASGSMNSTASSDRSRRMNRNWSPSGNWWLTIVIASGASTCRSMARLSGRAPRSAVNPWVNRNSIAESSHSAAHDRLRSPRRLNTSSSSLRRMLRIVSRFSGRKTTMRSMRLRNSRRNVFRTTRNTASGLKAPVRSRNPRLCPAGSAAPRFEVIRIIAWRKSAGRPSLSVSRPSSKTCRNRSHTRGCAFSNSSSRITEKGCLRI